MTKRTERRPARRAERASRTDRIARRAERREELLDAAIGTIREDGPSVSMDALAAAGGVTKPIIYRHFGDRAGLIHAVAHRFAEDLLTEIRSALGRQTDPRSVLADTVDAYLRFVEREPNVYRFVQQQAPANEAVDLTAFVRQIAADVAVVLGERLRQAGLDSGAAEPWAHALVGMVHLSGDWWLDHRTMSRERLVEYLLGLAWDGLSSLPLAADVDGPRALEGAR